MDEIKAKYDRLARFLEHENPELYACLEGPGRHSLFAHPRIDVSLALPGHPASCSESFMQPPGGPVMLRLVIGDQSAFVWLDRSGRVLVRPWSPPLDEAADTISSATSLDSAFNVLADLLGARRA